MLDGSGPPLALRIVLEPDADAEGVERLGRQLGAELRELDVDSVQPAGERAAPDGAKGVATSLAELLVTMSGTGGVLATVVATIRDWLGRRESGRVVLTIDGDTLELSSAMSAERAGLVDAFVRRHSAVD
jgi:hypothetical protein